MSLRFRLFSGLLIRRRLITTRQMTRQMMKVSFGETMFTIMTLKLKSTEMSTARLQIEMMIKPFVEMKGTSSIFSEFAGNKTHILIIGGELTARVF